MLCCMTVAGNVSRTEDLDLALDIFCPLLFVGLGWHWRAVWSVKLCCVRRTVNKHRSDGTSAGEWR